MSGSVFMRAKDVGKMITNYQLTRKGFQRGYEIFSDLIKDLENKEKTYKEIEKQAYAIFKVNDLPELQHKIDIINNSNLIKFANLAIRQSAPDFMSSQVTPQNLYEALNNYILDKAQASAEEITIKNLDNIIEESGIIDTLIKEIKSLREKGGAGVSKSGGVQRGRLTKQLVSGLSQYLKNPNDVKVLESQTYRKELTVLFKSQGYLKSNSTWEISYDSDEVNDIIDVLPLSYYPYYDLTPEQAKKAKKDENVWRNFKQHIANVVNDPSIPVDNIMDMLNPSAFIKYSLNDVIGVFGELQMLFIVYKLTGDLNFKATGPINNLKKPNLPELGADVLLHDTIGIQVKNYRPRGPQVYQLRKTFKWDYIQEALENDPNLEKIGDYYSAVCYNKPVKNATRQYKQLYDVMGRKSGGLNVSTEAYFASNIDKFITFSEAYDFLYGEDMEGQNGIRYIGDYKNAFYFFGAKTLVPVSYIIRLIIARIKRFYKLLEGKEREALQSFYFTYSYRGDVWSREEAAKVLRKENPEAPRAQKTILDGINFALTLNLKIEDLKLESGGPQIEV